MKYQPCFSGCFNLKPRPSESFTFGDGPLRTSAVRCSVSEGNALVGILPSEESSKKPAPKSFESFVVCSNSGCTVARSLQNLRENSAVWHFCLQISRADIPSTDCES